MTLHEKNRSHLCERLKKAIGYEKGSIVVLEGGEDKTRYSSDTGIVFRQVCLSMESRNCTVFSPSASLLMIYYFEWLKIANYEMKDRAKSTKRWDYEN